MASADAQSSVPSSRQPKQRTRICALVYADSLQHAQQELAKAASDGADLAQLFLDAIPGIQQADLKPLITASSIPVIAACRAVTAGGKFEGDEERRLSILRSAAQAGAQYIDIELDSAQAFLASRGDLHGAFVIVSHHDLEGTPSDEVLRDTVRKLRDAGGDVARVVTNATDVTDSLRVLELLRDAEGSQGPLIAQCLGERGWPTRVLAPKYGAFLTYGALEEDVPGVPSVAQLVDVYHLRDQTASTKVYGIAGTNVARDRNYMAHCAAYAAAGLDAIYVNFRVDDFPRFLRAFSGPDFVGFSVTMPFKGQALAAAVEKDPVAANIGAANTLVRLPDGGYKGLNTDWIGATQSIESGLGGKGADGTSPLAGKKVTVVGTGGAGQAVAFAASHAGAQVYVADVLQEKAEQLAASLGDAASVASLEDINAGKLPVDVLANASPIGMWPDCDAMALTEAAIDSAKLVFDAICCPPHTKLLETAEAKGHPIANGLDMFIGQAAQQYKYFTGRDDEMAEIMRKAVLPFMDPRKK